MSEAKTGRIVALHGDGGVSHTNPRADNAARNVDPMLLAIALEHIAGTAKKSRTSTRRLRWIERRAIMALEGREFIATEIELPKNPGVATGERQARRTAYLLSAMHRIKALGPTPSVMAIVDEALGQSETFAWKASNTLDEPRVGCGDAKCNGECSGEGQHLLDALEPARAAIALAKEAR